MKEKEEEYLKPIGILSDFNSRTGILATQISALNSSIYSSGLASIANSLADEYKAFSPIADLLPKLDTSIHSSVTAIDRDANLAISSLTKNENVLGLAPIVSSKPLSWLNGIDSIHSLSPISGISQTIAQSANAVVSAMRIESVDAMRITSPLIDQFKISALGIESNFSRLSATSILAESALSAFKWNELGAQIGIDQTAKLRLSDSFVAVSESYSNLFKSIQIVPQSIIDYNPSVIRRTPIEYYTGAELCRIISIPDKPAVEKELFSNQIQIENRRALERNLPRIDSSLFRLWDGANQALTSDNPDRVRHFSTSVRELMTNILHHLSPDDEVKKWSSNPSLLELREYRSAVISAITLLESVLRDRYDVISEPSGKLVSVGRLINQMMNLEMFEPNTVEKVKKWLNVRNSVVHTQQQVSAKTAREIVTGVLEIVRRIREQ